MESIDQTRTRLEAIIIETAPDADISPGSVLSELVVKLAATMHNPIKNDTIALSNSQYIANVIATGGNTYTDIIDAIASNYNVTRNQGRKVTGLIKVVVTQSKTYFLPSGFTFVQPNLNFKYVVVNNTEVINYTTELSDNQVALVSDNGLFFFIIAVEAEDVPSTNNNTQVTNLAEFTLDNPSLIPEFVSAQAYGNFSSGQPKETDIELISRFREGLTNKSVTSPKSLLSVLKDNFPTLKGISVIGANDTEMTRSKQNVFGVSTFGMADVYIRTSDSIETQVVTVSGARTTGYQWRIVLDKDNDHPFGFYRILAISPATGNFTGTYVIKGISYDYETIEEHRNNVINNAGEARFTKYQTCTVDFEVVDSIGDSTRDFKVTFAYCPLVTDIQNYIISDDNRVACADYLVKAAIPCDVSMKLTLYRNQALEPVDVAAIQKDIFTYINNIPFGGSLVVSRIIDICHNYNVSRVDLPALVTGTILLPGTDADESLTITGSDSLDIPLILDQGISKNTTTFFINYLQSDGKTSNIGIEVV